MVILWSLVSGPVAASESGPPPIHFEPYADQPRWYRAKLGTVRYIRDRTKRGRERRLVAVTPAGPLTPPEFYRAIGDERFAMRLDRRRRRAMGLLGGALVLYGVGAVTVLTSDDPDRRRFGAITYLTGIGVNVLALIPAFGHDYGARMTLPEAQERIRRPAVF